MAGMHPSAQRYSADVSDGKIETLRRAYESFNRGQFDAVLAFFDPDVEFFPPGDQPPYRGAEELRAWMEPDAFEMQTLEPLEFTVAGNKVLVEQHVKARGAGSGIELDVRSWNVWTFDEHDVIVRVETYLEREEADARQAAGLSE